MGVVYEYRVRWLREGGNLKTRVFQTHRFAARLVAIMGPTPWVPLGKNPDAIFCCSGHECGCGGVTWREHLLSKREGEDGMPPLMFAEIQRRRVEPWEPTPTPASRGPACPDTNDAPRGKGEG